MCNYNIKSHLQLQPKSAAALGKVWPPVSGKSTILTLSYVFPSNGGWRLHLWPCSQPLVYPAFLGWPLTSGCTESQPGGYDLAPFITTFWTFNTPEPKSETVCSLGINDLSCPCPTKVCEYVDPSQPFISASFYYTASSLLPRQQITEQGRVGRRAEKRERGGKQKKARKEREMLEAAGERGRDEDVKWGHQIGLREDRLAASAALTEKSPLNGFPVLDARPRYLIFILLGSCSSDDLM